MYKEVTNTEGPVGATFTACCKKNTVSENKGPGTKYPLCLEIIGSYITILPSALPLAFIHLPRLSSQIPSAYDVLYE
jgi:hypothetical protein